MKTIFITIFQGVEAKNILRTDIYRHLLESSDVRIVFFVKNQERADYYRREFSHPRVSYEVVDGIKTSFTERLFSVLKFQLIHAETLDLRRRMHWEEGGSALGYALGTVCNRLFAHRPIRRFVRWLDERLVSENTFDRFFEKYRPDLVFLAHLFDDVETSFIRTAKRFNVRTLGFVNSWDKLTARCMIRILPERLIVYSGIVKAEAMELADMPAQKIIVAGIPQFDRYVNGPTIPREAFLKRLGFPPQSRFFVYAPLGRTFSNSDWEVIDLLHHWLTARRLGPNLEMLVRFQPNDFLDWEEIRLRPWLRYDYPGKRFSSERGVDWDMADEELEHLTNTLAHVSLLVCYASSLSVDAAVFDKPIINIGFEIKPAKLMSKSPTHYYGMTHYRKALASGGIRLVKDQEELLHWIRRYLEDPSLDRESRLRLVAEQCGVMDDKAGERIASVILSALRG